MPVTIAKIDSAMCALAPRHLSESYDNDGIMICENLERTVTALVCALEIRRNTVEFAIRQGADCIVTHHPFLFHPKKSITGEFAALCERLFQHHISVLSYHTRLDAASGGVNDLLAKQLGLTVTAQFGGESGECGRIGVIDPSVPARDFGEWVGQRLGCSSIRASLGGRPEVRVVAVVGGAGKDMLQDAATCGAHAFVTADVPHHAFVEAAELGLNLYDCGHYETENCVVRGMCDYLTGQFPTLPVMPFDVGGSFVNL